MDHCSTQEALWRWWLPAVGPLQCSKAIRPSLRLPQLHQRGEKQKKPFRCLPALIKGAPPGSAGWTKNSGMSQQPETGGDGACRRGARHSFLLRAPSGEPERGEAAASASTQRRVLFPSGFMLHCGGKFQASIALCCYDWWFDLLFSGGQRKHLDSGN